MNAAILGVTPPISLASATPKEINLNDSLIKELKVKGSFESESATRKRVEVLNTLQKLTEEFVYAVCKKKNMSDGMARDAGGKIFTYGSYRLGVYGPGSDIDMLVVVPKHVNRQDFFEIFGEMLKKRPELEEITPVEDAFVPIIKIEFGGISIDVIFAKLDIPKVPRDLTLENKALLRNLDEKDLRSLNGTRVTDEILTLVPRPTVFKHALRCIKMWAQSRAVYGNVFGFPGGVAWAMLVARICQLYPNTVGALIVEKFFQIYCKWNWPQPVLLKQIEDGPLQVRIWNPRLYPQDRQHRMPVITPAYPSMCSTHNITKSTQEVILKELNRGAEVLSKISAGTCEWSTLFERHTFFHDYKFYLCVVAATKLSLAEHAKWSGFIESRMRLLVQKLEINEGIELAHPYVKDFTHLFICNSPTDVETLISGYGTLKGEAISSQQKVMEASTLEGEESPNEVHLTKLFIGLKITDGHKKLDIQQACLDFFTMCKSWPTFLEGTHVVQVKNVKVYDLPNDVFEDGESRPVKSSKRKRLESTKEQLKKVKTATTP